jgi:hypothetical protein
MSREEALIFNDDAQSDALTFHAIFDFRRLLGWFSTKSFMRFHYCPAIRRRRQIFSQPHRADWELPFFSTRV